MRLPLVLLVTSFFPHAALAGSLQEDPGMGELLRRLGSSEPSDREKAFQAIVKRSFDWSEPELELLRKAVDSPDAEIAASARQAVGRIRVCRAWRDHLLIEVQSDGKVLVEGNPAKNLAATFKRYSVAPTGEAKLRLLIRVDPKTPFVHVHRVLKSAVGHAPVHQVFLEPRREPAKGKVASERVVLLSTQPLDTRAEGVDWKDKFILEVNYHYVTQQIRNKEIARLRGEVEKLKAQLEKRRK